MSAASTTAVRIARTHNALRQAVLEGGVLAFSPGAHSLEPLTGDAAGVDLDRLPFEVRDHEVTPAEVDKWLRTHREWQAEQLEARERERERSAGFATGSVSLSGRPIAGTRPVLLTAAPAGVSSLTTRRSAASAETTRSPTVATGASSTGRTDGRRDEHG